MGKLSKTKKVTESCANQCENCQCGKNKKEKIAKKKVVLDKKKLS